MTRRRNDGPASHRPGLPKLTPNCFIVRDANGQALSYVYDESEPGRVGSQLLSKDEVNWSMRRASHSITNQCRWMTD
jgi:hypothetical protein